jgi:restriction endonuclease S subunit
MKLSTLADIRTGLVLARKKADKLDTDVKVYKLLTLKSFDPDGFINTVYLDDFTTNQYISNEYITQEGDVLIRLSEPNTAVYIDHTLTGFIIPSLFAIIRLKEEVLNRQYLTWLLNSQHTKREMQKSLIGSAIQVISTSFLQELHIKLIPMERQERIAEMNTLCLREKTLLTRLIKEKEMLYKLSMNQIYREGT